MKKNMNETTLNYLTAFYYSSKACVYDDVMGRKFDHPRHNSIVNNCMNQLVNVEGMGYLKAQKTLLMIQKHAVRAAVEWLEPFELYKGKLTWWRGF